MALGLVWGWPRFVGVLLIGFLCMLHPAEYLSLTRADLLLPTDVLTKDRVAYVAVRNPKTARFARRQHSRLEDTSVLRFLEAAFESLPFDAMLFPGTKHTFKSQWNAILARLGIPYKQIDKGITPVSSGAAELRICILRRKICPAWLGAEDGPAKKPWNFMCKRLRRR